MKLIVGLGNPGTEYDQTRHNVGFEVIDRLARRFASSDVAKSKFHAAALDADIDGERALLLKPTTYMNRSGLTVAEAVRFYKLDPADDLLVLVDEVALECGTIRLRGGGSSGGHNGLGDIEQKLGTDQYPRLRVGVDSPGRIPRKDYVLGRFTAEQSERLEPALEQAVAAARCWIVSGIAEAMNQYNRRHTA